jgi:hypothetical protein
MWMPRLSPLRLDTKARVNSIANTAACLANHQFVISAAYVPLPLGNSNQSLNLTKQRAAGLARIVGELLSTRKLSFRSRAARRLLERPWHLLGSARNYMTIRPEIDILILPISCPFLPLSFVFVSGYTSTVYSPDFAGLVTLAQL